MALPLVVRRSLGGARDLERLLASFRAEGVAVGARLRQSLADDRWGVVILAERRGVLEGWVIVRWFTDLGAEPDADPTTAVIDRLWVASDADGNVAETLHEAAKAEAESRGVTRWTSPPSPLDTSPPSPLSRNGEGEPIPETPPSIALPSDSPSPLRERGLGGEVTLSVGIHLRLLPTPLPDTATLWSGAQSFRTRWRADLTTGPEWNHPDTIGSTDVGADVLRFDSTTGRLRETWFLRPRGVRLDGDLLDAARNATVLHDGAIELVERDVAFEVPPTVECLYDAAMTVFAGFTEAFLAARGASEEVPSLTSVRVSPSVVMLFSERRYVGWRVDDPAAALRPMGWPETRESHGPSAAHRDALVALLGAWMTLDARGVVRPDESDDAVVLDEMRAVRDEARRLAALEAGSGANDPLAGVARDVAADVHWRWGFFRVGE